MHSFLCDLPFDPRFLGQRPSTRHQVFGNRFEIIHIYLFVHFLPCLLAGIHSPLQFRIPPMQLTAVIEFNCIELLHIHYLLSMSMSLFASKEYCYYFTILEIIKSYSYSELDLKCFNWFLFRNISRNGILQSNRSVTESSFIERNRIFTE